MNYLKQRDEREPHTEALMSYPLRKPQGFHERRGP